MSRWSFAWRILRTTGRADEGRHGLPPLATRTPSGSAQLPSWLTCHDGTENRPRKKIHNRRISISLSYKVNTLARLCSICAAKVVLGRRCGAAHQSAGDLEAHRRTRARMWALNWWTEHGVTARLQVPVISLLTMCFSSRGPSGASRHRGRPIQEGRLWFWGHRAASSLTGTYLLPEIIAEFQHSHPGARFLADRNGRAGGRTTSIASREARFRSGGRRGSGDRN